jgi:hypothetical protein
MKTITIHTVKITTQPGCEVVLERTERTDGELCTGSAWLGQARLEASVPRELGETVLREHLAARLRGLADALLDHRN